MKLIFQRKYLTIKRCVAVPIDGDHVIGPSPIEVIAMSITEPEAVCAYCRLFSHLKCNPNFYVFKKYNSCRKHTIKLVELERKK